MNSEMKILKHLILIDYYSIFQNKINLKRSDKYVAYHILCYYTWKNIKNSYKNNDFKISAPT